MKSVTSIKLKSYLENMYGECRHCPNSLAYAANKAAYTFNHDKAFDLFTLLIENKPIPSLHTHSYSFNTATGRYIINTMKELYYEHKSTS